MKTVGAFLAAIAFVATVRLANSRKHMALLLILSLAGIMSMVVDAFNGMLVVPGREFRPAYMVGAMVITAMMLYGFVWGTQVRGISITRTNRTGELVFFLVLTLVVFLAGVELLTYAVVKHRVMEGQPFWRTITLVMGIVVPAVVFAGGIAFHIPVVVARRTDRFGRMLGAVYGKVFSPVAGFFGVQGLSDGQENEAGTGEAIPAPPGVEREALLLDVVFSAVLTLLFLVGGYYVDRTLAIGMSAAFGIIFGWRLFLLLRAKR